MVPPADSASMWRSMLKSKLHRATVTHTDVDYEGSLTLDRDLLDAADIVPFEEVHVWNVTRGTRFRTYAMEGAAGSRVCCVNGAAAHLANPGDIIIVATFAWLSGELVGGHRPRVVLLGEGNCIQVADAAEVAGPEQRAGRAGE